MNIIWIYQYVSDTDMNVVIPNVGTLWDDGQKSKQELLHYQQ